MSNNIIIKENRNINAIFSIDYEDYKINIIKEIFKQLDIIISLFNEEFNDNLIKIYILYKKKLLNEYEISIIKNTYMLCKNLIKLNYVDQEEYLNIIILLINLHISFYKYNKHKEKYSTNNYNNYKNLINIDMLILNLSSCIVKLSDNNMLFKNLLENINSSNKNNIINLAEILCDDYFMYLNQNEMYKFILNSFSSTKNKINYNIKKYKIEFEKTYEYKQKKLKEIYTDQVQIHSKLVKKFKYQITNPLLNELCKDFYTIHKKIT